VTRRKQGWNQSMAERFATKIRQYCEAQGISIPIGFKGAANRYAIIELTTPPKLVARTWFNQEDVVYYLGLVDNEVPRKILDFKDGDELILDGKKLRRVGKFDAT
jgi:hypothetical protein